MHGGYKYVVEVVVGEARVCQGNWLVFLIRCGDPPVWTRVTSIRTPAQLQGKEGEQRALEGQVTGKKRVVVGQTLQ